MDKKTVRLCTRPRKGGGSLGRPRYLAVAYWRGGQVLREAKALVPSAWTWAHGSKASQKSHFLAVANGHYRAPDPFLHVREKFIFRRVAADSTKIELGDDAGGRLHLNLLQAMGFDACLDPCGWNRKRHSAEGRPEKTAAGLAQHRRDGCSRGCQARFSAVARLTQCV